MKTLDNNVCKCLRNVLHAPRHGNQIVLDTLDNPQIPLLEGDRVYAERLFHFFTSGDTMAVSKNMLLHISIVNYDSKIGFKL